ncbi:hypothetical protein BP6252_01426 [Coleophoma cylindrospora]|uniref:AB hydrolase-1 domain-containing protein n=1 Tax=Coleophoma cylindrospora TaxID=1849047 RepID=A0A3D8ST32_9HELO|nr:hypothetical protein BP6252_01426 [Coleophoma cylindrospora]
MTVALRSPGMISSIIAVDNSPTRVPLSENFAGFIEGMREVEASKVKTFKEADEILKKYEASSVTRLWLLANLKKPDPYLKFRVPLDILDRSRGALGDFPFTESDPVVFEKPALFLRAKLSHYVPDESLPAVKRFFPNAEIENVDSGHWIIQEKPSEFQKAVVDFCKRHLEAGV